MSSPSAGDQATVVGSLYELDHAAPARTASLADGHAQTEITRLVGIEVEGASTVHVAYPPAREITASFSTGPMGVYEGTVTLSVQVCHERVCLRPVSVRLFR